MTDTFLQKIAKAAAEMDNPKKRGDNPHFKSKFASLADTMDVIKPVLEKYGLGHVCFFDGTAIVYQVFNQEDGEALVSRLDLSNVLDSLSGNVWQGIGQGFTYMRRYLAQAFWSLVPEDDDAQSAPTRTTKLDKLKGQVRERALNEGCTPKEWLEVRGINGTEITVESLEQALKS